MRRPVLVVLFALAAVSLTAQDQPVFRAGANYIRVDMYATADGKPIEDLTAEEVEIFEDDAPQKIEAFEHVKVRPAASAEQVDPVSVSDSRRAAGDPRARVFVIFLDTYHTQLEGSANMRQPLVRFLERVLGPDDLVAVMTPEMAASDIAFGRKTTVISNMMATEWWGRRARLVDDDPKEELYEACGLQMGLSPELIRELKARRREQLTLDALEDLVVHLGGIREERKAVLAVTEGWVLFTPNRDLAKPNPEPRFGPARPPIGRPPVPPPSDRGFVTPSMQIECEADRIALGSIDHPIRLRRIGEDSNRGNVTFYPVYARGLAVFDSPIGPDPPPSLQQDVSNLRNRHDSLRTLASDTDGESIINTNNIEGALKRITDDLSSYYLMAYYSSNSKLDGRFRRITVKVKRPGVRVRARRGYRGMTAEEVSAGSRAVTATAEAEAVSKALNAIAGSTARGDFRIHASAWTRDAGAGTFWVVGELDFRTRRDLAWTAGAIAELSVVAADGTPVASKTVEVPAGQGMFALQVPETGSVAPGEYAVRVRMRPDGNNGLALSDTARVIVGNAAPIGEAILLRRGPSTGTRYLRTADPRFQRSERIRLELPALGGGAATARMLDRAGKLLQVPVQITERADPSGFRWLVADANLAPLAPGDYGIEVAVGDAKQITGFRVVP